MIVNRNAAFNVGARRSDIAKLMSGDDVIRQLHAELV